ncbi:MAG: hypothetical protein PHC75_08915 [Burkholderiales bacterium]|nr:hypothetical protein [Burkholderiales bacterium]
MSKKLSIISLCLVTFANADCLDKLTPAFSRNDININVANNKYTLSDNKALIKSKCTVTPNVLEKFVNKNFIRYSSDKAIISSWNYLAIDKKPVYDYLKLLKEIYNSKDGASAGNDSTSYQLYGVVNNSFACYKYSTDSYVAGTAHPNSMVSYYCSYPIANNQELSITQAISQADIIKSVLQNKDIVNTLKKIKVKPTSIKTLGQLQIALQKDDTLACVLGDGIPTSFAITKLNSDGTIDALYSLGTNAPHVCQAATPSDIIIKNVRPLIKINTFITSQNLNT